MSQLTDSNVKNGLLLSVTNLTPNITDLLKSISSLIKACYVYLPCTLNYF